MGIGALATTYEEDARCRVCGSVEERRDKVEVMVQPWRRAGCRRVKMQLAFKAV